MWTVALCVGLAMAQETVEDAPWPEETSWPEDEQPEEEETSKRVWRSGPAMATAIGLGAVGAVPLGVVAARRGGAGWGFSAFLVGSGSAAIGAHLFSEGRYHFELAGALAGAPIGAVSGALLTGIPSLYFLASLRSGVGLTILGVGTVSGAIVGMGVGAWYAAMADSKNKWDRSASLLPTPVGNDAWGATLAGRF
jgi:hypothetical protein